MKISYHTISYLSYYTWSVSYFVFYLQDKDCKAQPQLQVKPSLKAEEALISFNPANGRWPQLFLKMENNLNLFLNGKLANWKMTSILR